jgi:hypothetical protein
MRAIAPVTCGADMLVPVLSSYRTQHASGHHEQQLPGRLAASALEESMTRPGAAISGFGFTAAPRATGPRLDDATMPVDGQQSHALVFEA